MRLPLVVSFGSTCITLASGHGWITEPPARNAEAGAKNGWCPHCGNGNGICGDGNQWPAGSDYLNHYVGPVKTWQAGTVQAVEVKITAHHKGHFEMSICDEVISASTPDPESCFQKYILERASAEEAGLRCEWGDKRAACQPVDPLHKERFYLPPPGFSHDGSDTHRYFVKLPGDLTCEACTLQWRWWTANSCIPAVDYACFANVLAANGYAASNWGLTSGNTCPGGGCDRCACGEEFRNCADVTVLPADDSIEPSTTRAQSTVLSTAAPSTSWSAAECVSGSVLTCINGRSTFWPKCNPQQTKQVMGPSGYEFGFYCTESWTKSLNEMLSDPAVDKCTDADAIHKLLAQIAYETGYFSTVYQPQDGGAGLVHMIPANWEVNARDMDDVFPGHRFEQLQVQMGKFFFQDATYGWKSVAAWFKRTNAVIPGCGRDLFAESYDEQTRCILGSIVDRQEAYDIVGSCLFETPTSVSGSTTSVVSRTTVDMTTSIRSQDPSSCVRDTDCSESAWCDDAALDVWCSQQVAFGGPCPRPYCESVHGTEEDESPAPCVRNKDCSENAWCDDTAYDTWCPQQVMFGDPCPEPQCSRGKFGTANTSMSHSTQCVRNTDCSANAWCADVAYDTWCPQQIMHGGPCPAPHCAVGAQTLASTTQTLASTTNYDAPSDKESDTDDAAGSSTSTGSPVTFVSHCTCSSIGSLAKWSNIVAFLLFPFGNP